VNTLLYDYDGHKFPNYLRDGNACRFILPVAQYFCVGRGVDVGPSRWPFPGAIPVELTQGGDAMQLPVTNLDYVLASHSLEHLINPVAALEHWQSCLRPGGVLFLYLPSRQMKYWRTSRNRKHLHEWEPQQMVDILTDLGFIDVLHSERDMAWSFCCVGWKP
jgi:SAM-dependent methyltransferase